MQNTNPILQAIRKLGEERIPLTRVYRCLYSEDLFLAAYGRIYKNQGALTPGTENDTVDGMSIERIHAIIEQLRHERFRFRPVRRSYADKKDGGKRPLGLPNFTEKLVQEVLRMILNAYYEPRFSNSSHGFRPGRGCQTALTYLHHRFRGATWFIEGDIRGCFDHIDHEVLMGILSRDIQDGRLLNLIRMGLKAGMMEDWDYSPTYSGVPQGGIVSPILSNIYLHELDTFIEEELTPQYARGKRRASNLAYRRYEHLINKAKERGDADAIRHYERERKRLPSYDTDDPNYRRLRYCRYADDFILGFIGPKSEAEAIKTAIGAFLRDKLHLEMSEEKTLITHARTEHARFLGYAVSVYDADHKQTRRSDTGRRGRSANGHIRLGVPFGLVNEKAKRYQYHGEPCSELRLLAFSDAHIIDTYQQRFRGLAGYYKFATDRSHISTLKNVMQAALVKTLAHKYKMTVSKVYQKYRSTKVVDGQPYKTLAVHIPISNGERVFTWGGIPLKAIKPADDQVLNDIPYRDIYDVRSDIIRRLQADTCELCGWNGNCEAHHVRKLSDLKQRWAGRREKPKWVQVMIALRRKTLIVCRPCHEDIHAGRPIPNEREMQVWRAG